MILVVIEDVVQALATAQNIYKTSFQNTNATNPSYKEFGEDIRKLAVNLDLLLDVLKRVEYQAGPPNKASQYGGTGLEVQVLGSFKQTLDDCKILLSDEKFFPSNRGPLKNLWYPDIEPEVENLRRRIACYNIKFSIVFKILDPQVLEDRSIHIVNSTAHILDCAERLGQLVHGDKEYKSRHGQNSLTIPSELENELMQATRQSQTDCLSLDCSLDAAIQYFDSITMLVDNVFQDKGIYYVAITNIMIAIWIVRNARRSQDYQIAARFPSNTAFARQMDFWGVTVEGFFDYIEEILQEALRRILGPQLVLPPTSELLAMFERRRPTSQSTDQINHLRRAKQVPLKEQRPVEMEDTSVSNRVIELPGAPSLCEDKTLGQEAYTNMLPQQSSSVQRSSRLLQSSKLHQSPQLYLLDKYSQKQHGPIEMEDNSITNWDVERMDCDARGRGMPLKSPDPKYTQTLQIDKQRDSHSSLILITTALSEGREKETADNYELDKVQIIPSYAMRTWTAASLEPQTIIFRTDHRSPLSRRLVFQQKQDMFEFQQKITGYKVGHDEGRVLVTSQETTLLGGSTRQDLCRLQLWHAPARTAEDNLALLSPAPSPISIEPGSKRKSQSSISTASVSSGRSMRRSTPSLFSIMSSSSRRSSITVDPPSYTAPSSSTVAVYTAPTAPCVILFAHRAPTLAEKLQGRDVSRSFLVIEIDPEITIEEELAEEDMTPAPHRCVLKRKSSYLQARRSLETSDPALWDLAAVGLYQREAETEAVKKLKHVIFEFDTHTHLVQFLTKANLLKALAKKELAKFIQATGERK